MHWMDRAAIMTGLPPNRSVTMGVMKRLPMLKRLIRLRRGRQADPLIHRYRNYVDEHNPVASAAEAVDHLEVPEFLGASYMLVEHPEPELLCGLATDSFRRVVVPGPIRLDTHVGGTVTEENGQQKNDAAPYNAEGPEGALPARIDQQEAHEWRQECSACSASGPKYPNS